MSVPETPYTRGEMYLSAIADGDSGGIPERPYTRKEMYLDAITRGDSSGIPERPYTREEMYLDAIAKNGGGGGGSNWKLLASEEFEVTTSSTTEETVGSVELPDNSLGANDIIWIHVRDKAGKRTGYWYGADQIFLNYLRADIPESPGPLSTTGKVSIGVSGAGSYVISGAGPYGVYATMVTQAADDHAVIIKSKYSATFGTIDGTIRVEVYKLTPAPGMTIFE